MPFQTPLIEDGKSSPFYAREDVGWLSEQLLCRINRKQSKRSNKKV